MNNAWASFSDQIAAAVERAAESVVQVHGHRRPAAGVVFADNHVLTPAAIDDDKVAVHTGEGHTVEGVVLGRVGNMGLTVVRVDGLGAAGAEGRRRTEARTSRGGGRPHLERRRDGGARAGQRRRRTAAHRTREHARSRDSHPATAPRRADRWRARRSPTAMRSASSPRWRSAAPRSSFPRRIAWAAGSRVTTEGGARQGFLGVSSLRGRDSGAPARRTGAGLRAARQPGRRRQPRRAAAACWSAT